METKNMRPVLVTTAYRGVFFGYLADRTGQRVCLKQARNAIFWSAATHGFLGLAVYGPGDDCRIGPAVNSLELEGVTCIAEVDAKAVKRWEAAPWDGEEGEGEEGEEGEE